MATPGHEAARRFSRRRMHARVAITLFFEVVRLLGTFISALDDAIVFGFSQYHGSMVGSTHW